MIHSHLLFAHSLWADVVRPGDTVLDATLGNGHDALVLARLLHGKGHLIGYDIQQEAILQTQKKLLEFPELTLSFHQTCHSHIADPAQLIVYNLGYLPGSNKRITTLLPTTFVSVKKAQSLVREEGMISITLYPGHEQGLEEYHALLEYSKTLDNKEWLVSWTSWPNRNRGPSVLIFQKKKRPLPS